MKELAGGADDWQMPGDAAVRISWEQVRADVRVQKCASYWHHAGCIGGMGCLNASLVQTH